MGEYTIKECVIFDIDGTLALTDHRQHLVREKPYDWKKFFEEMVNDPVNEPIRRLYWGHRNATWDIFIFSGRPEEYREITEAWLNCMGITGYEKLLMRPTGDYRQDPIVKREFLEEIRAEDYIPVWAYDDRDQVVQMWREEGITCLQVAEGNF